MDSAAPLVESVGCLGLGIMPWLLAPRLTSPWSKASALSACSRVCAWASSTSRRLHQIPKIRLRLRIDSDRTQRWSIELSGPPGAFRRYISKCKRFSQNVHGLHIADFLTLWLSKSELNFLPRLWDGWKRNEYMIYKSQPGSGLSLMLVFMVCVSL